MKQILRMSLCTCISIVLLFAACRKAETVIPPDQPTAGINQKAVERFLTLPENAGHDLQAIAQDFRKKETEHPFLTETIQRNGAPAWKYAISPRKLFTSGGNTATNAEADDDGAPLYFIPMVDPSSNDLKSFIICTKESDSAFKYKVYNKEVILHQMPNSIASNFTGTTILGIFAAFENTMNNKAAMTYNFPWTMAYKSTTIRFDNSSSNSSSNIKTNGSAASSLEKKTNSTCPWVFHSQNMTLGFGDYGETFMMAWYENICTHETQLIGIYPIGGFSGGTGGSGGGNTGGGSSGSGGGGGFGGSWTWGSGGTIGGSLGNGTGPSGGGAYINPVDPGSIFDSIFGVPPYQGFPDPTWPQPSADFVNQFLMPTEGQDGDAYDANYWDDPNLNVPAQTLPTWNSFNNAFPSHMTYPEPSQVYALVGGDVLSMYNSDPVAYRNTCALRLSRALNYAGINIPAGPGRFQGSDGKYYFLGASTIIKWMQLTFGMPAGSNHLTHSQGGPAGENFPGLMAGKKGIYGMLPIYPAIFGASGHADKLYNSTCDGGCFFSNNVQDIFIWELQ